MIETGIHALITQSSGFQGIAGTRLYPVLLPEEPILPAATYQRISTKALYTLDDRVNFTQVRLQIDTWAGTYSQAKDLHEAINGVLDNFSGDLPDGTHVYGIQLFTCNDLYESEARIYRVTADYMIQLADAL